MAIYLKIPHSLAQDILKGYQPSENALAAHAEGQTPADFLDALQTAGHYSDLVIFLAHALPVKEAVWWACCCTQRRSDWSDAESLAIQAACAWVKVPDETNRRYADKMAGAAGLENAPGWVAQAVFWSGGSLMPEGQPQLQPQPGLCSHAVAGAINLSAVLPDGNEAESRYADYISMGLDIASGGNGDVCAPDKAGSRPSSKNNGKVMTGSE